MSHYKYLLIGGGMTADAAIRGIREVDAHGAIGLIGNEPDLPYNRPPLSKGLWKGKPLESIWRKTEERQVELHLQHTAKSLDLRARWVTDEAGTTYTYDKLLLATGGTPRRLPYGEGHIIYYRTLADYKRLRALTERGQIFAVIGGGFIGSEVAAALSMDGKQVVMIFPEETVASRVFPHDLGLYVTDYYRQKGVRMLAGETVKGLEVQGEKLNLKILDARKTEHEIQVDGVVAGIGIQPNVELAQAAGLAVENGIVVDEFLRTSHPDVFAAGDVAAFYNPALGKRIRVEHEDNANTMGLFAGRNMAGKPEPYHHLPFFYSDLFELGYEAVGELDSRLETVTDWKERNRKGVIYYMQDGRVRGVLLWNVWDQVKAARKLIAEAGPFGPRDLDGRLPEKR